MLREPIVSAPRGARSVASRPAGRLRRVLYAIELDPSRKLGSLEEQVLFVARAFRERDGTFLPLFLTDAPVEKVIGFHEAGIEVACLDLSRFRWSLLRQLRALISQHRIEIVHWGLCPPLHNPYLWWLALLAPRVQHYFTDHISRDLPLRRPGRLPLRLVKGLLLRRYARVLGVSQFVVDCLHQQRIWSNVERCLHFINTDRFRPDETARAAVRAWLGAENNFVVLAVAYLIHAKGIDVLLQALVELPAAIVVWVVGDGPEQPALEALARELGVEQRVRFLGEQARVEPYMQAADCFVCPSRWAEAAGLVNLESQAVGLPVVASRVGGIPEYVEDGHTGLLFPAGDHRALAGCVRGLHEGPEKRQAMGAAARALVVERFSPAACLESYLSLYRSVE
jgi:glycosyltransferase involved in cell wall biosynthesis